MWRKNQFQQQRSQEASFFDHLVRESATTGYIFILAQYFSYFVSTPGKRLQALHVRAQYLIADYVCVFVI